MECYSCSPSVEGFCGRHPQGAEGKWVDIFLPLQHTHSVCACVCVCACVLPVRMDCQIIEPCSPPPFPCTLFLFYSFPQALAALLPHSLYRLCMRSYTASHEQDKPFTLKGSKPRLPCRSVCLCVCERAGVYEVHVLGPKPPLPMYLQRGVLGTWEHTARDALSFTCLSRSCAPRRPRLQSTTRFSACSRTQPHPAYRCFRRWASSCRASESPLTSFWHTCVRRLPYGWHSTQSVLLHEPVSLGSSTCNMQHATCNACAHEPCMSLWVR